MASSFLLSLFEAWRLAPFDGCGAIMWKIIPFVEFGWKEMLGFLKGFGAGGGCGSFGASAYC